MRGPTLRADDCGALVTEWASSGPISDRPRGTGAGTSRFPSISIAPFCVSTTAMMSPRLTASPACLTHSTSVPASMSAPSEGIRNSATAAHEPTRGCDDRGRLRQGGIFDVLRTLRRAAQRRPEHAPGVFDSRGGMVRDNGLVNVNRAFGLPRRPGRQPNRVRSAGTRRAGQQGTFVREGPVCLRLRGRRGSNHPADDSRAQRLAGGLVDGGDRRRGEPAAGARRAVRAGQYRRAGLRARDERRQLRDAETRPSGRRGAIPSCSSPAARCTSSTRAP
jgi:hypothetical protein